MPTANVWRGLPNAKVYIFLLDLPPVMDARFHENQNDLVPDARIRMHLGIFRGSKRVHLLLVYRFPGLLCLMILARNKRTGSRKERKGVGESNQLRLALWGRVYSFKRFNWEPWGLESDVMVSVWKRESEESHDREPRAPRGSWHVAGMPRLKTHASFTSCAGWRHTPRLCVSVASLLPRRCAICFSLFTVLCRRLIVEGASFCSTGLFCF